MNEWLCKAFIFFEREFVLLVWDIRKVHMWNGIIMHIIYSPSHICGFPKIILLDFEMSICASHTHLVLKQQAGSSAIA